MKIDFILENPQFGSECVCSARDNTYVRGVDGYVIPVENRTPIYRVWELALQGKVSIKKEAGKTKMYCSDTSMKPGVDIVVRFRINRHKNDGWIFVFDPPEEFHELNLYDKLITSKELLMRNNVYLDRYSNDIRSLEFLYGDMTENISKIQTLLRNWKIRVNSASTILSDMENRLSHVG